MKNIEEEFYELASTSTAEEENENLIINEIKIKPLGIPLDQSIFKEFFTVSDGMFVGNQLSQITKKDFSNNDNILEISKSYYKWEDYNGCTLFDTNFIKNSNHFFNTNRFIKLFSSQKVDNGFNYFLIDETEDSLGFLNLLNDSKGDAVKVGVPTVFTEESSTYLNFLKDIYSKNKDSQKKTVVMKEEFIDLSDDPSAYIYFVISGNFVFFREVYFNNIEFFKYVDLSMINKFKNVSASSKKYDVRDSKEGCSFMLYIYTEFKFKSKCSKILKDKIKLFGNSIDSNSTNKLIFHNNNIYCKPFEGSIDKSKIDYLSYVSLLPPGKFILNNKSVYEIKENGEKIEWIGINYSI